MSTFFKVLLSIVAVIVAAFIISISGSLGIIGFALFFGAMALIWKND